MPRYSAHDRNQLVPLAQRRVAAGYLHIGVWSVVIEHQIDAPEQFLERNVLHRLGVLGQVARRAIEIAALRDLERHAADRPAPAHQLASAPLAGAGDAAPRGAERSAVNWRPLRRLR